MRDVFLSYNRRDHVQVDEIRAFLASSGIQPRIDTEDFRPGFSWISAIEKLGDKVGAFAVFFGKHGLGPVQRYEIQLALLRSFQGDFPVIPVLLPGADLESVPPMLKVITWIDLRDEPERESQLAKLVAALPRADGGAPQAAAQSPVFIEVCPYLGLDSFGEEHQAWFFGREEFSRRLLEKVSENPFCLLAGPSGSGKSSVIQAGLIPLLRKQSVNRGQWVTISMTPTKDPFGRLAERLYLTTDREKVGQERIQGIQDLSRRLAEGSQSIAESVRELRRQERDAGRVLLIVDQFEEILTLAPEKDRKTFAAALMGDLDGSDHSVLIGVRDDFFFEAVRLHPVLDEKKLSSLVFLDRMTPERLQRAIEGPAQAVGVVIDPVLTANLLNDLKDEPGNLPLLEFALKDLWDKRTGNRVEADSYEIGSVASAIADRAEKELKDRLANPGQARSVRSLLCRLVKLEKEERGRVDKYTRNRVRWGDLTEVQQDIARQLSKPGVRLLVLGTEPAEEKVTVEVAHEALIQHWPRLREWLVEDRDFLLFRQKLQQLREIGGLLDSAAMKEAGKWLRIRREDLSKAEIDYVESSHRGRLLGRLTAVAVALVAIVAVGYFLWVYLPHKQDESDLRAKLLASGDFGESLNLAGELAAKHGYGGAELGQLKRSFVLESLEHQKVPGAQVAPASNQEEALLLTQRYWHRFLVDHLKSDPTPDLEKELATPDLEKELAVAFWSLDRACWGRWDEANCIDAKLKKQELLAGLQERLKEKPHPEEITEKVIRSEIDNDLISLTGKTFKMGSEAGASDERPIHKVAVPSFRLLKREVSNELFGRLFAEYRNSKPKLPAANVDWYRAYLFSAWVGGRLPTEAEWEFAARSQGDEERIYPWKGNTPASCENDLAVISTCFGQEPLPGCSKPMGNTDQGLCDMAGNVWEWTADWLGEYQKQEQPDPWGPPTGGLRVIRGGSFSSDASYARVSYRNWRHPDVRYFFIGFRVLVAAAPEDGS